MGKPFVKPPCTELTIPMKAILGAFRECGVVLTACHIAGVASKQHREWLRKFSFYKEAFEEAVEDATDRMEAEARRRAIEGVQEPVFYQGEIVGYTIKYSDMLLDKLLKAYRPDKFKERHEITGAEGKPLALSFDLSNLTDEELSQIEKLSEKLSGQADSSGD